MGGPSEPGRDSLRLRALERIEHGRLPDHKPTRVWGGHGTDETCSLCDKPITATEPEMELEFDGAHAHAAVRFHIQCQIAWEHARRIRASSWTLVSTVLPPLLHIVEARVTLGGARAVIMNVMRVNHGDTGPLVWLNANTNSPLPETWNPMEWRPLAGRFPPVAAGAAPACASSRTA